MLLLNSLRVLRDSSARSPSSLWSSSGSAKFFRRNPSAQRGQLFSPPAFLLEKNGRRLIWSPPNKKSRSQVAKKVMKMYFFRACIGSYRTLNSFFEKRRPGWSFSRSRKEKLFRQVQKMQVNQLELSRSPNLKTSGEACQSWKTVLTFPNLFPSSLSHTQVLLLLPLFEVRFPPFPVPRILMATLSSPSEQHRLSSAICSLPYLPAL